MNWRDRPMAALDTETTGVDIETCRIVTACVGLARPKADGGWSPRNWMFTQEREIPAEAVAIHKITTEHANSHGTDPAVGLVQIRDDLYRAWHDGMPVVAFNAVFDLSLLDRELRRHGLPGLEVRGPVVDPYVIDKQASRRRGSRKLVDQCEYYGIPLGDDAHGAEADARAAARLAWKMCGQVDVRLPDGKLHRLGGVELGELNRLQVGWFREQRESFAAYLARKGERLDNPSTVWPLTPFGSAAEAVA